MGIAIHTRKKQWRVVLLTLVVIGFLGRVSECLAEPPITAMAISLDNKLLITGSQSGLVVREWPSLDHGSAIDCGLDSIHDVCISPDGKRALVAGGSPGSSGVVQLRSFPELALERSWSEHHDVVYKVAWSANGLEWVSVSWDGYCRICKWDAPASHVTSTSHSGPVFAAAFLTLDALATAGADRTIAVWSSVSGQTSRVLRQHTGTVHALALQPARQDGQEQLLASASEDRTIRFWQPSIGRMVRFHRLASTPRSIAWTHDGRWLIAGNDDGAVVQLDPTSLKSFVLSNQAASVLNLVVGADDARLLVSEGSELVSIVLPK